MISQFIISLIVASLISLMTTPLVRNFFIKRNWVEYPWEKQKKTKNATALAPVPRGGGIPVYLAVVLTIILFLPLDKHLLGIIIACTINLLVGVADDLWDLSPGFRLITNVLAALAIVISGIGIAFLSNPFGGVIDFSLWRYDFTLFGLPHSIWIVSDLLAIIWITWCTNIVGWSTGVDGQLPGLVVIAATFIGILGLRFHNDITQWPVIVLAGALAGAYLGFLPYNIFPQSIMPGYGGKSLAGLLLAVLAILSGAKLATLILLLSVPMVDAIFVIIRRLLNHQSIFQSDNRHLHHQLLRLGWKRSQIAVFYWLVSLLFGIISLFLNSTQKFYAFLGIFLLLFSFTWRLSRRI
ncbi:MAG TPA: MraY family glycosyltransferase [Candidatus Woesebacteria bacterium]|nr:MraY family glycosyltransferase [Candidatus Woesebacteria bacterium]HRT40028.1 MraY family glycosyltransferase [Candidatus Woesebacteria bacterium]